MYIHSEYDDEPLLSQFSFHSSLCLVFGLVSLNNSAVPAVPALPALPALPPLAPNSDPSSKNLKS